MPRPLLLDASPEPKPWSAPERNPVIVASQNVCYRENLCSPNSVFLLRNTEVRERCSENHYTLLKKPAPCAVPHLLVSSFHLEGSWGCVLLAWCLLCIPVVNLPLLAPLGFKLTTYLLYIVCGFLQQGGPDRVSHKTLLLKAARRSAGDYLLVISSRTDHLSCLAFIRSAAFYLGSAWV